MVKRVFEIQRGLIVIAQGTRIHILNHVDILRQIGIQAQIINNLEFLWLYAKVFDAYVWNVFVVLGFIALSLELG